MKKTNNETRRPIAPPEATALLLTEFASILNRYGANSKEAEDFIGLHSTNDKFVKLARLSAVLKRALTVEDDQPSPD